MTRSIITISRQFASGGRDIGKALANRLGVPFYDKELIALAAKESGFHEKMFENADEQATGSLLYSLSMGAYAGVGGHADYTSGMNLNDRVYVIQAKVIREIAAKGPCVIVGRCADYILSGRDDVVNVFIHGSLPVRVKEAVEHYGVPQHKAESLVVKTDKRRASYHDYYADRRWGEAQNYHLCLNSDALRPEDAAAVIASFVERREATVTL